MAKKTFSTYVEEKSIRRLKHLAVDEDRSLGDLISEAIDDIVRKYRKKSSYSHWQSLGSIQTEDLKPGKFALCYLYNCLGGDYLRDCRNKIYSFPVT